MNIAEGDCEDGDIRLVNGDTQYEGRLEICINNAWGTICRSNTWYNRWTTIDSNVACRQLGHMELGNNYKFRIYFFPNVFSLISVFYYEIHTHTFTTHKHMKIVKRCVK